jgi:hypothetical protein
MIVANDDVFGMRVKEKVSVEGLMYRNWSWNPVRLTDWQSLLS